jgi:hypothetical protein
MVPEAYVSHQAPSRLRIKIPSKKGNSSFFSTLIDRLAKCPGVEDVKANPQIGSVLIVYTSDTKAVADFAKKSDLFHLKPVSPPRKTFFLNVADTFRAYDKDLKKISGGELDIPSLVFVSLLISGIWQIARGNLGMPAWYTAFYYALGVFAHSQVDEPDEGGELVEEFGDVNGD